MLNKDFIRAEDDSGLENTEEAGDGMDKEAEEEEEDDEEAGDSWGNEEDEEL